MAMRRSAARLVAPVTFGKDTTIFERRSLKELARTMLVFRCCGIRSLVRHTRTLLQLSERVLGAQLTYDFLVRRTVFQQFCAGESEKDIAPALNALSAQGIGPILDYAAEAAIDTEATVTESASSLDVNLRKLLHADIRYASDAHLDDNVGRFLSCMDSAQRNMPPSGLAFAAVKITGLGDPQLLARMSAVMLRTRQTWAEYFIPENEGTSPQLEDCRDVLMRSKGKRPRRCSMSDFRSGLQRLSPGISDDQVNDIIDFFDSEGKGYVHYFDYTSALYEACFNPDHNPPELKPFLPKLSRFTPKERELQVKMNERVDVIVKRASDLRVRVMMDAEQSYYQVAIDGIVRDLQRKYNKEYPCVYNTYQAYLKPSFSRVTSDLARSKREGWLFGAKIVRGAYLETERKDAQDIGYESPVHDTIENTHAMYDQIGMRLLDEFAGGRQLGILFGTHNVQSLKLLTQRLVAIEQENPGTEIDVAFAQLYGMGDHLTLPLAKAGYKAFKYLPYGPVKETVFYLQRRAEENSEMLRQSAGEWPLLKNEFKRKLFRLK